MIIFLLVLLLMIFLYAFYVSIKKNLELFERLELLDEALQTCIKSLDEQIEKIDSKTKIGVFSDEPIIKELVLDMSTAKQTVVAVSAMLSDLVEEQEDIET